MTEHVSITKKYDHECKVAEAIVAKVGEIAISQFRTPLSVQSKGNKSPVTEIDRQIELQIRSDLAEAFPDDGFYGEEYDHTQGSSGRNWIIDPIDGTRAYITGHPLFGVLVSLIVENVPVLGVVGMPALGEIYTGVVGMRACMNGSPIKVSRCIDPAKASIYINEAELIGRHRPEVLSSLLRVGQVRRFAHDCYSLALLASGSVDAVIDFDLQPYDFMATVALVQASGGTVTDWQGRPIDHSSNGEILAAATKQLHKKILRILGH